MAPLSKNKIKYIHSLEQKKIRKEERVFLAERIARHNAYNHVESGGLTGTVWPQQTDNFPGVDGQADVFYHATAFIGFCKVLCS